MQSIISEISITDILGSEHKFQIQKIEDDTEVSYETVKLSPEPKDVQSSNSFGEALEAISSSLFFDEIEL